MSALDLKALLEKHGITQGDISRETGLSKGSVSHIVSRGHYPVRGGLMFKRAIAAMLVRADANPAQVTAVMYATKNKTPSAPHAEGLSTSMQNMPVSLCQSEPLSKQPTEEKEDPMLLRKQTITQATKQLKMLFCGLRDRLFP